MQKKGKLELTWVGKYDEEKPVEPRILLEDPEKSYGDPDSENMLIHGDNLIALQALQQDYAGKIKCIYIDPPFNTGQAFENYDDNEENRPTLCRIDRERYKKQIYAHMDRKTQDVHIVQKDLIVFRKFVKSVKKDGQVRYDKPFTDKSNIKKYLFTGYRKSYYPANAFDSDTERLFSIILEEDPNVIRWIKPPLNQLGLFWKAGQQYNPDFLVETTTGKYMVEVKALNEVNNEEVVSKAREGIRWCTFATTADPDHKTWEYRLISDDNIHPGNTCKYTLGTAHPIKEED